MAKSRPPGSLGFNIDLPHWVPTFKDIPHRGAVLITIAALVLASWVVLVLIVWGRAATSTQPRAHLFPDMDKQLRANPQEKSPPRSNDDPAPFFEDGAAMRPQVPGTVSRDPASLAEDDWLYRGYAVDVLGMVLLDDAGVPRYAEAIPPAVLDHFEQGSGLISKALLDRGQARHEIFCTPCHGPIGLGDGAVKVRNRALNPASYHQDRLRAQTVGQLFSTITNGFNTMKPYKSQIPLEDRWAVAAYVRVLQRSRVRNDR